MELRKTGNWNFAVKMLEGQANKFHSVLGMILRREAELLRYFAINPDRVISRDEILLRVWRINPTGLDTRTVDMHVARLRQKLRDDPARPTVIITVRSRGYMFAGREEGS